MPDTFDYLLLGYAFIFGIPLLYIGSWWVRQRNLEKDIEILNSLNDEKKK